MNIKEAIHKAELLNCASPASIAALSSYASLKRLKKGEHMYLDRHSCNQLFIVAEGIAAIYKISDNDERRVVFVHGAGKALNEEVLQDPVMSCNCDVLTDSLILCFERERFLYACKLDFELYKAAYDSMAVKMRRLYRQVKNSGNSLRGDKRIASRLWKLSRDYGIETKLGTEIAFDMTVTFLADMLGSKRETVSRQLKLLTQSGLLVVRKNRFIIPDRNKLHEYFHDA